LYKQYIVYRISFNIPNSKVSTVSIFSVNKHNHDPNRNQKYKYLSKRIAILGTIFSEVHRRCSYRNRMQLCLAQETCTHVTRIARFDWSAQLSCIFSCLCIVQTCKVSHIRHETHTFEVYLTLSRLRLKIKSHAFTPHLKFHFFCTLQTKVTKNCYHQMHFLGS